jgi:RimJ/RimL family protein N-acetyltransferase
VSAPWRERRASGAAAASARSSCCLATPPPHDYRRLELEVFAINTAAIRLYEREGFVHEGRRRGAVIIGDEAVDMVMMGRGFERIGSSR